MYTLFGHIYIGLVLHHVDEEMTAGLLISRGFVQARSSTGASYYSILIDMACDLWCHGHMLSCAGFQGGVP